VDDMHPSGYHQWTVNTMDDGSTRVRVELYWDGDDGAVEMGSVVDALRDVANEIEAGS